MYESSQDPSRLICRQRLQVPQEAKCLTGLVPSQAMHTGKQPRWPMAMLQAASSRPRLCSRSCQRQWSSRRSHRSLLRSRSPLHRPSTQACSSRSMCSSHPPHRHAAHSQLSSVLWPSLCVKLATRPVTCLTVYEMCLFLLSVRRSRP